MRIFLLGLPIWAAGCAEAPDLGPTTLYDPTAPAPSPTGPGTPTPPGTPPTGDTAVTVTTPGEVVNCVDVTYPPGAAEPMTFGEVLSPYAWPDARRHSDGVQIDIDLAQVPCGLDPDIDWSPFDVLLFVSIPAW